MEELEWDPSQSTATAWQTQVAPKIRGRRTYSRRGSTGAIPSDGQAKRTFGATPRSRTVPVEGECCPSELESACGEQWGNSGCGDFVFGRPPEPKLRHPRSHSITGVCGLTKSIPFRRTYSVSSRSDSLRSTSTTSIRSSSISSFLDSTSSEIENFDPNYDPLEDNASPKRAALVESDKRGRKKVRSARNLLSLAETAPLSALKESNSFSHLARHGESLSWAKPGAGIESSSTSPISEFAFGADAGYLTDATGSSPATASLGSSRKRGICGSPTENFEDGSPTAGLSASHSRSRSRIFSPPISRMSAFSLNSFEEKEKTRSMDIVTNCRGESDQESREADDSGDEVSVESASNGRPGIPSLSTNMHSKWSSVCGLNDSMYGNSINLDSVDCMQESDVLSSMSSYLDLKFLVRTLRKESGGRNQSWHVAPPATWKPNRRASFLQWATKKLGFTLRAGGITISYLQISKSRGANLLKLLEASLILCKTQGEPNEANESSKQKALPPKNIPITGGNIFTFGSESESME